MVGSGWYSTEFNLNFSALNEERGAAKCTAIAGAAEREQLVLNTIRKLNLNWQGTTLFIDKLRTNFEKKTKWFVSHWRRASRAAVTHCPYSEDSLRQCGASSLAERSEPGRRAAIWPDACPERWQNHSNEPFATRGERQCLRMSIATIDDKLIESAFQYRSAGCRSGEQQGSVCGVLRRIPMPYKHYKRKTFSIAISPYSTRERECALHTHIV